MQNRPTPPSTTPIRAAAALIAGRAFMLGVWAIVPPAPSLWVLLGCMGLDLSVLLWQIALVRKSIRKTGSSLWSYLLGLGALIATAMVAATALNRLSNAWILPPPTIASPVPLPIEGETALLQGPIDFDTYEALKATLALEPPPKTLALKSAGGRIGAARGLARLVHEAGLATHVTQSCASACTLIFAAGHARTKTPSAQIGFHGYRLISDIATVSASEEASKDIATLAGYGISQQFLERAFAVPHAEMWFPTDIELLDANVLTGQ